MGVRTLEVWYPASLPEGASEGFAPPNALLAERQAGIPAREAGFDPRIRAADAIAPWGIPAGFWDAGGLAGIETPALLMAGSEDDVSGYEHGTGAIFEGAVNAEHYQLTFENARHHAAAPIPAPREAWSAGTFAHCSDPLWDTVRMISVAQHFVTAFFDLHPKGDEAVAPHLDLAEGRKSGFLRAPTDGPERSSEGGSGVNRPEVGSDPAGLDSA